MTEAEWIALDDPGKFTRTLEWKRNAPIRHVFTERKLRLFAVACCRQIQHLYRDPGVIHAADLAEALADASTDVERQQLKAAHRVILDDGLWSVPMEGRLAQAMTAKSGSLAAEEVPWYASEIASDSEAAQVILSSEQAPLLRDIVANPFRPVTFDPDWRTSTAVALARLMYEAREFSAMPILADALQDAGCADDAILTHCRDPEGVHVRGCWVVDLVLGKS